MARAEGDAALPPGYGALGPVDREKQQPYEDD